MALSWGTSIVTNGLILAIDAGNPKCFMPGNTTCNNLIGGGLMTGASGTPGSGTHTPNPAAFPTHNGDGYGCFYFNGSMGINCEENLGTHTKLSMTICFKKTDSSTRYFTDARNDGGVWFLSNYSSWNINHQGDLAYNFEEPYNASNTDFLNHWFIMTVTSDSTSSVLYLNGEEISGGLRTSFVETLGANFRIGTRYTTSSGWVGYMGPILINNYKFSANEVKQNFNALKWRFNL